jgi:hypothetical protein
MASAWIATGLTAESRALIASYRGMQQRIVDALDTGFAQYIREIEASVQANELSGKAGSGSGGGTPVGLRTGELRRSVRGEVTGPLEGFVGTTAGTTTPYAHTILGPGTTTIEPVNAKHLWVPIAANLTPSKVARYTPRALFDAFGDRVKIFTSKAGNTVVFVEDPRTEGGGRARYKRNTKGGRKKGDLKGKLYFVLKDRVVIQGTDALARGAERMGPRGAEILTEKLRGVLTGGGA